MPSLFLLVWGLVPIVMLSKFEDQFYALKWLCIIALAIACAGFLAHRAWRGKAVRPGPWLLPMILLLATQVASLASVINPGVYAFSVSAWLAIAIVMLYVSDAGVDPEKLARVTALQNIAVLVPALAVILGGIRVFWPINEAGTTVGARNAVSIHLAQLIPILLMPQLWKGGRKGRGWTILAAILITLNLYVILVNRTRSAWIVIGFYAAVLLAALVWRKGRDLRPIVHRYFGALGVACLLLFAVPTQFRWTSSTPYLDSLKNIASLERSSGRDQVMKVELQMARENPLVGCGAGHFLVRFNETAPRSGADSDAFAYRSVQCGYNEFIRAAAESGLLGAIATILLGLFLPVWVLLRRSGAIGGSELSLALLALAAVGTSLNAMVECPFFRPSSMLVFGVALAAAGRGLPSPFRLRLPTVKPRQLTWLLVGSAAVLALVLVPATVSLMVRRHALANWKEMTDDSKRRALDVAYSLWKWDQWPKNLAGLRFRAGDLAGAEAFAKDRQRLWPLYDDSVMVNAAVHQLKGNFGDALDQYRILFRHYGRCPSWPLERYQEMINSKEFPKDLRLRPEELGVCREEWQRKAGST
ncbi:MAG TPA: O-antigen ligase family protein [Bdellovibrionota bacterium]|nr:O-antigen ligase family protein [Bdellovibrionota bacterium]